MRRSIHRIDTSRELLLQRWAGGYMLIRPEMNPTPEQENYQSFQSLSTLGEMLDQPFDVYLYNNRHCFQIVNEEFVRSGYLSMKSLYGKHATEVFPREGGELVRNNTAVLATCRSKIAQENILLSNGITQKYLSIKSPLYNENGTLVGIFGASMLLGVHNLAPALLQLVQLGMLNATRFLKNDASHEMIPARQIFSRRERECLLYISRSKTSKEIAGALNISIRTVEHYIENIKIKTGSSSRSELIAYAINLFS